MLVLTVSLAALLAGCDRSGGSGAGGATPAPPPVAPLAWAPCGEAGAECATLTVPVDHDRPEGPRLDLAVARRRAADPTRRIGSVVINPGGPGASGVDLVKAGSLALAPLAAFDLVSWDPRGVGASRPLECGAIVPRYRELDWTPDDDGERDALDATAGEISSECRNAAGDLAGHLSTADSARDLDRLRAALGEERLTYVGFSYGTALGLHYAARFPARVRAMVLDGVADPREDLATFVAGQAKALEAQLARVLGPGLARYDRLRQAAESSDRPVKPGTLAYAAIAASYRADGGALLSTALDAAERGDPASLIGLADSYWATADYGAYAAVTCSDQAHPDGPRAYDDLVAEVARQAPRFGAVMANELRFCAWWPTTAPPPTLGPGGTPILVVGNTGDVATPYESAQRVAAALGSAGALLTFEGEGHTSLGRSGCVDRQVRGYLEDLTVPQPDMRCPRT